MKKKKVLNYCYSYENYKLNLNWKKKKKKYLIKKINLFKLKGINSLISQTYKLASLHKRLLILTNINLNNQLLNCNILLGYNKVYYNLYTNNFYLYINYNKLYLNYFITFENLKKYFLFNSSIFYKNANVFVFANCLKNIFFKFKNLIYLSKYLNFFSNFKWIKGMFSNFNSIKINKFYLKKKKFPASYLVLNKDNKDSVGIINEFNKVNLPLNFILNGDNSLKKTNSLFYIIPGNPKSVSLVNYILLINYYILINIYLLKKKYLFFF